MYLTTYVPTYLCTYLPIPTYINAPTYLCLLTKTYQPISTYHHLPTYLPTYLPLPIPKYQYIIAADPGASIGLVSHLFVVKIVMMFV